MKKRTRFWFLVFLGTCVFGYLSLLFTTTGFLIYTTTLLSAFLLYCCLLYRLVYKGTKPKYPLAPPEGRVDAYLPRTSIPRPVYEDMQKYSELFKIKKRRKKLKKN